MASSTNQQRFEVEYQSLNTSPASYPNLPTKAVLCALCLLLVGITLIISGFVEEVVDIDPTRGIAFWVLGLLTIIPGSYFSYKFYKAYRAKTPRQRREILREIPDLN